MAANRQPHPERLVAWGALTLLAAAAAFAFSPNLREGPVASAQHEAQRAAARLLAAPPAQPAIEAGSVPLMPLVSGAGQVRHSGAATRVRLASVGIDAEVRSVGFVLQRGQLEYDTPRFEAGHYAGTADPGRLGNVVIGGHVANRGALAVFSRLPEAQIGDVVEVFSGPTIYRYSITELRVVAPDATAVMGRTHDATLTLITCSPDPDRRQRLIVVGKLL